MYMVMFVLDDPNQLDTVLDDHQAVDFDHLLCSNKWDWHMHSHYTIYNHS